MLIRTEELPADFRTVLFRELRHSVSKRGHVSHLLKHLPADGLSWSTPHRIAILPGALVLQDGAVRTKALMTGWRVLLHHGQAVVSAVELRTVPGKDPALSRIDAGPAAKATEAAIRQAEQDPAAPGCRFEPLHLMVPDLFIAALWLRGDGQTGDSFRLLPPVANGIAADKPLDDDTFHAVLRDVRGRVKPLV